MRDSRPPGQRADPYRAADPTFRALFDTWVRTRQECQSLLDVVRKEHHDQHPGAIHSCRSEACRLAARHRRA